MELACTSARDAGECRSHTVVFHVTMRITRAPHVLSLKGRCYRTATVVFNANAGDEVRALCTFLQLETANGYRCDGCGGTGARKTSLPGGELGSACLFRSHAHQL